ncbi:MAG: peptidase M15 [Gammaproteobacteria bacterium]|nr:MAG: peptidase M15 [Gammaproteobacteria bacterium]
MLDSNASGSEIFTLEQLTGQNDSHLIRLPASLLGVENDHSNKKLLGHPKAVQALLELQAMAEKDQQTFQVISGYRSYEQQRNIWNRKFTGELAILNAKEQLVDILGLEPLKIIESIMLYSALPGASRHHWGTDFDIFPVSAIKAGHKAQLLESEFSTSGVAGEFNQWMSEKLSLVSFFRPYEQFQGGIACEPWHISYYPLANAILEQLHKEKLLKVLNDSDLAGSKSICANIELLYEKYISNICSSESSHTSQ